MGVEWLLFIVVIVLSIQAGFLWEIAADMRLIRERLEVKEKDEQR